MKILRELAVSVSGKSRQRRAETFRQNFVLDKTTKILDIGSESGENINIVLKNTDVLPENVFIGDIDSAAIEAGYEKFGYQRVWLDETGYLPFEDNFFDIVYCSSVIEHVTIPKDTMWELVSGNEFQKKAFENQLKFANEIRRIGKQYFVQTPAKYFPVESHTWLPLFAFLSRPLQIKIIERTNKFWIKKAVPDFNLLTKSQMMRLFPDAKIILERKYGLTKSIMAIKSLR